MGTFKTPLRYPGGKQRLWPFVDEVLVANDLVGGQYAEAYAGGAGIALELLLRKRVSCIHLNDSCIAVYAFWHSILNETERFCRKISRASLTVDEWKKQREIFKQRKNADLFELGFATFYLNRCNRSGILTGGVIGGLDQTGEWKIDARFSRNDLINRIEVIGDKRKSIRIRNWDAERFLVDYVGRLAAPVLVYCDPPFFQKADRLYPNYYKPVDHERVAKLIQSKLKCHWLVSYDSCLEILVHYSKRKWFRYSLQYNANTAYKGTELFIASDKLKWPESSSLVSVNIGLEEAS